MNDNPQRWARRFREVDRLEPFDAEQTTADVHRRWQQSRRRKRWLSYLGMMGIAVSLVALLRPADSVPEAAPDVARQDVDDMRTRLAEIDRELERLANYERRLGELAAATETTIAHKQLQHEDYLYAFHRATEAGRITDPDITTATPNSR